MATKACIACSEPIQETAKLCKHCGTMQNDRRFADTVKPIEQPYKVAAQAKRSVTTQTKGVLHSDEVATVCNSCGHRNAKINVRCTKCDAFLDHKNGYFDFGSSGDNNLAGKIDEVNGNNVHESYLHVPLGPTPGIAIAAIVVAFFIPILGLILGYSARAEVRNPNNPKEGDGLATGAIVIGWLWIAVGVIWILVLLAAVGNASNSYGY